ncbi:MAG: L-xylulose-5-phosphate 3-epimerase [Candidatus Bathyarchaeota archaeon B63]|nr:MAG: L-xylulose-5-phosphate 3-epimerase [Candidatus Bathyarchaeota archaeon B63]
MRKGVNAWIYPSGFTVDEVLESSAKIGFDGVELNLTEDFLELPKKARRLIAEKAASLGLELPSLCTGLFWKFNPASPDEKRREKAVKILKVGCEFASDIGSEVFLVVPAVAIAEVSYSDMWRLSKESILKAAPTAEDHGVILGIENVWNRFLYSPLEFRRFIEEIDHPYVRVYLDIGNILFLGFPQQWIHHLSDLIVCIHVKDFLRSKLQFRQLLEGDVPWPDVMEALREVGYDGFLNVEVPPYPGHPLKAAMDSKTALDIILEMKKSR